MQMNQAGFATEADLEAQITSLTKQKADLDAKEKALLQQEQTLAAQEEELLSAGRQITDGKSGLQQPDPSLTAQNLRLRTEKHRSCLHGHF